MSDSLSLVKYVIQHTLNFFFTAYIQDGVSIGMIIMVCLLFSVMFSAFLRVVPGVSLKTQSAYREPPAYRADRSLSGGK